MSIPTSRVSGVAEVSIDRELCTLCGACVEVCKGWPLVRAADHIEVDQSLGFGCIACGACLAVCPTGAIQVKGRDLFPEDVFPVAPKQTRASYEPLKALLDARRSTRNFLDREVSPELITKILDAASTSPMGIPPSDVGVLVFQNHAAVREARDLLLKEMRSWSWMFTPLATTLLRPFLGKENAVMFRDFIGPAIKEYKRRDAEGKDWFFYNAPTALYFYGTAYNDPADAYIPAALAMVAAESLGLGTCLLGFPGFVFQYSKKVKEKYTLPKKIQPGIVLIFGYSKYPVHHAIKRRFRDVRYF